MAHYKHFHNKIQKKAYIQNSRKFIQIEYII